MGQQQYEEMSSQQYAECCATHPRPQSNNVDSFGGRRRQKRGALLGDRTSETSQGGID